MSTLTRIFSALRRALRSRSDLVGCTWLRSEHLPALCLGLRMSVHYEDGVVFVETSNVYATATYRVTDPDASIARCVERGVELLIRARAMSPAIERVLS